MAITVLGYLHHYNDRCDLGSAKLERFARGAIVNTTVALRLAHNPSAGSNFCHARLWEDAHGATFAATIPDCANAGGLARMIRSGCDNVSMSFRTLAVDVSGCVSVIRRASLSEISIVPEGAYPSARCWVAGDVHYPADIQELADLWHSNEQVSKLTAADMMPNVNRLVVVKAQSKPRRRATRVDPIQATVRTYIYGYLSRFPERLK